MGAGQFMNAEKIKEGLEKGKIERRRFEELEYLRVKHSFSGMERGTVITRKRIYPAFPHIPRIFVLENGIKENIKEEYFHIEEKIDGYNVRIIKEKGKLFALSRSGIIDAFSTEKIRELLNQKEMKEEWMVCGEMIGNTPYTKPTPKFDVKYYVFDVYELNNGRFVVMNEKKKICRKINAEMVPYFGRFSINNIEEVKKIIKNISKKGKEGIVIKSESRKNVVKYVQPFSDSQDIEEGLKMLFDMPAGFFKQRLMRIGIFSEEHKWGGERVASFLGKAVLQGIEKAVEMIRKDGYVYDEFEIRIKNKGVWDELKDHMGKEVDLKKLSEKKENGLWRIRFRKIYKKSSRELRSILKGRGKVD